MFIGRLKSRVKLRAHAFQDDGVGFFEPEGLLVDPLADQGIIHVRDCHDPGLQRDLLPGNMVGIALPVPPLVMIMRCVFGNGLEGFIIRMNQDLMGDPGPLRCMAFHQFILFRRETPGLSKHGIVDGDLSKIVQRRGFDDIFAEFLRKKDTTLLPDLVGQDPDAFTGPLDMAAGGIVPALHHHGQAHDEIVMHLYYVAGLFFHLFLQFFVIRIQKPDIFLVGGVIYKGNDIAALTVPVVEVVDIHVVDPFVIGVFIPCVHRIYKGIVLRVFLEVFQKMTDLSLGRFVPEQFIHGRIHELRDQLLCYIVAPQVPLSEIEGYIADLPLLDIGIDHRVADIIQIDPVGDKQKDRFGDHIT